ncbi:hypothetical protein ACU8KG_28495 (plasmid) [Rhizobium leguminosarum]
MTDSLNRKAGVETSKKPALLRRDEQDDPRIRQAVWYWRLHAWLADRDISAGFEDGETWRRGSAGVGPAGAIAAILGLTGIDDVGVAE